jgi:hypothetical protein
MSLRIRIIALILVSLSLNVACNRASSKNTGGGSRVEVSETEAAKLAGFWKGTMKTKDHGEGTMELTLKREGEQIKASAKFYNDKLQFSGPIRGLEIKDSDIKFYTNMQGANVFFTGQANGEKLAGTLEAVQRSQTVDTGDWDLNRQLQ